MTRCPKLDRPTWSNDFPASIQKDAPPFPPSPLPPPPLARSLYEPCRFCRSVNVITAVAVTAVN